MNNKVPCAVISDILPLYNDKLTSEETNEVIREHLKECEKCRQVYDTMSRTDIVLEKEDKKDIDFLKKIRQRNKVNVIIGVICASIVISMIGFTKVYIFGEETKAYETQYTIENDKIIIKGKLIDSEDAYSNYEIINEKGMDRLKIFSCKASHINNKEAFEIEYKRNEKDIEINGDIIKNNGFVITKLANQLYENRNKYIGNMPANGKIAGLLNVHKNVGNYLNSLQTTTEPYSWTFEFDDEYALKDTNKKNEQMKLYACAILAMIDNCNEVNWNYKEEYGITTVSMSTKVASEIVGMDIKQVADNRQTIQEMLNLLGIE